MKSDSDNSLLKVATLNTWHGLDGVGSMYFGALESRRERMARLSRQINCLLALDADILLLQEVNPLPFRAEWYAQQLGKRCTYVSSNSGIKLGWGPPGNLNEGLAILYPVGWDVEFLGKKRLSGRFRFSPFTLSEVGGPFLSFQLHESRIGMAVRLHLPPARTVEDFEGPSSVLLGVTHVHHAPAPTARNLKILEDAKKAGELSVEEEAYCLTQFRKANARRSSEVDGLAAWLESLRKKNEPIILTGDFNAEPESEPVATIIRRGWHDCWTLKGNSEQYEKSATWDPLHNVYTQRAQGFKQPGHDFSENVARVLRKTDELPRRIDYIFVNPSFEGPRFDADSLVGSFGMLKSVERFGYLKGNPLGVEGLKVSDFKDFETHKHFEANSENEMKFVSDHLGLVATFGL